MGDDAAACASDGSTASPFVYLLSTGRSGSTLLDLLLGTHPELVAVGELQLLPFVSADHEARCGCGEPYGRCPFWGPLLADPRVGAVDGPYRTLRETRDAGRVLRPRLLGALVSGRLPRSLVGRAATYAAADDALRDLIRTQADGRIPVDSSKDPYRLGMVDAGGLAELHVVWLVRDPRGVVCSLTAPRGGSESPRATRRTRAALRWSVQQLLFDALARRMRRRATVTVVRYEDLATDPAATLARIAEAIGVDSTDFDVDGFRSHRHHAVATNPMVARDDPVVLDESWRGAPRTALALTWLVCGLPARRFGYRWSGPLAPSRVRGSAGPRVAR